MERKPRLYNFFLPGRNVYSATTTPLIRLRILQLNEEIGSKIEPPPPPAFDQKTLLLASLGWKIRNNFLLPLTEIARSKKLTRMTSKGIGISEVQARKPAALQSASQRRKIQWLKRLFSAEPWQPRHFAVLDMNIENGRTPHVLSRDHQEIWEKHY